MLSTATLLGPPRPVNGSIVGILEPAANFSTRLLCGSGDSDISIVGGVHWPHPWDLYGFGPRVLPDYIVADPGWSPIGTAGASRTFPSGCMTAPRSRCPWSSR